MALAALALVASGCGLGRPADAVTSQYLTVGTTDKVSSLDPAGSYDNGSLQVMTSYTCKLKPNLKFANGHALTSSDVKFSIDRENKIK